MFTVCTLFNNRDQIRVSKRAGFDCCVYRIRVAKRPDFGDEVSHIRDRRRIGFGRVGGEHAHLPGRLWRQLPPDQADLRAVVPVERWVVDDVAEIVQVFQAFGVSGFGTDAGDLHEAFPVKGEWVLEAVAVPVMKQRQVKADMIAGEACFML